jgi:hypothetical protein
VILQDSKTVVAAIDLAFQHLMTQHVNPLEIKESSSAAIDNLKLSIGLVYDS